MTSTISTTSISSASSSVNSSSHSHSISSSSSSISTDSHSHWDLLQSALLHPVWSAVSKPVMVVTFAIAAFISGRWMYHRTLRRHQIRSVPCGQYDLNSSSYRSASDIFEQSLINYTIKKRMKKRRELLKKEGKMSEEEIIKQLSKEQSHGLFHPHNSNSIINDYDDDDESDGLSDIILRNPTVEDIPEISQQNLDSFNEFNASVGLPPEFAAGLKQSTAMIQGCMDEGLEGVVAVDRKTGVIMASAFNDEIDVRPRVPGTGISTVLDFNSNIYGAVGCGKLNDSSYSSVFRSGRYE